MKLFRKDDDGRLFIRITKEGTYQDFSSWSRIYIKPVVLILLIILLVVLKGIVGE